MGSDLERGQQTMRLRPLALSDEEGALQAHVELAEDNFAQVGEGSNRLRRPRDHDESAGA